MLRVALKGLLGHKIRFLLTTLAVVVGVTFVAGAFVLTDSIEAAFDELFETSYEGADVFVQGPRGFETSTAELGVRPQPSLDADLVETVADLEGVAEVEGSVEGIAAFVAPDGEPILPQAPTLAFSWVEGAGAGPLNLRDGRAPEAPGEVTMDAGTFERYGFELGDTVEVIGPDGVVPVILVGVTGFGESDNLLGATIATFELGFARELFDKEGRFDEIAVVGDGTVDPAVLASRIEAVVGDTASVTTSTDRAAADQADVGDALGFLTTALLAFAGIALFVGSFLVVNTFGIVVAQRSREFALLRAVGASRRQVSTAVLVEALTVGLIASAIGLLFGIGLANLLPVLIGAFGIDLPTSGSVIAVRTVVVAFIVGTGVTMVAAIAPARRASRVPPVEAMRGAATQPSSPLFQRSVVGAVLAVVGAAGLILGLSGVVPQPLAVVGAGAAVAFIGVTLLAPLLAGPVARLLGALPARFSVPGKLARGNAGRDPRRTASTASALMIGLALVSAVTILTASIQGAVSDALVDQFRADLVVQGDQTGLRDIPSAVVDALRDDPAIAEVSPIRFGQVEDDGTVRTILAVETTVIDELLALGGGEGSVADLDAGGIALQAEVAADRDLQIGDPFPVVTADGRDVVLTVEATFETAQLLGGYVVSLDGLRELAPESRGAIQVMANAAGDLEAARAAVEQAVTVAPGVTVTDQTEFRQQQEDQIAGILGLMIALLALAIVVALLGIANTLVLAVIERTREIGLLRAVGMDRRQTRRMVLWESMFVSVFGALLGVGVGTFLGWALVTALRDEGIARMIVPVGQLGTYVVVAAVFGVIAGVLPAIRASRLDVLKAVTVE